MCLQVLCNLRLLPPLLHSQPPLLAVAFVSAPPSPPPNTHDHTPYPHTQNEAASLSCWSRVGSKSWRPSAGPALRLLGSRRNTHPSPDCIARLCRSANCKSWEGERQLRRPERFLSTRLRLPRNATRSICPAAQFVLVVCAKVKEPVMPSPPRTPKWMELDWKR